MTRPTWAYLGQPQCMFPLNFLSVCVCAGAPAGAWSSSGACSAWAWLRAAWLAAAACWSGVCHGLAKFAPVLVMLASPVTPCLRANPCTAHIHVYTRHEARQYDMGGDGSGGLGSYVRLGWDALMSARGRGRSGGGGTTREYTAPTDAW